MIPIKNQTFEINSFHNTPGGRLKYVRENILKLSRVFLSQKYGLSVNTLIAWELERVRITEDAITRCINIYGSEGVVLTKRWILTGIGASPQHLFELNRYLKNKSVENESANEDDSIALSKEIDFFISLSSNSVVILVANNDMLPLYSSGDYVGGRHKFGKHIEQCIGKDCIIQTLDGSTYVRRIIKNMKTKNYNLTCLNPNWYGSQEPVVFNVEIVSAAPIIWHRKIDQ